MAVNRTHFRDTHGEVKKMTKAGFTPKQAETVVDVLNNLLANIPTREELRELELRMIGWMVALGTLFSGIVIAVA